MTKKSKYEENAFTNLVKAIDAKWGHTYLDVVVEEQPIDDLLDEIREMEYQRVINGLQGVKK